MLRLERQRWGVRFLGGDGGAAPVEFVLVGFIVTLFAALIVQFAVVVYARNVVHDAAVDGAYHAALADTSLSDGDERAADIITHTLGTTANPAVRSWIDRSNGYATVVTSARVTLPLFGFYGVPHGMEVTAHAPVESLTFFAP